MRGASPTTGGIALLPHHFGSMVFVDRLLSTTTRLGVCKLGIVLAFAACSEEAAPEPEPTPFALEIGTWDRNLGDFTPMVDGSVQPLISGFQGLLFVNLALATNEDIPTRLRGEISIELPGLDDSYSYEDNQIYFESELLPDGSSILVVPSFRVPFERSPEELDGQAVELVATIGVHSDIRAVVTAQFVLRDASNCIHLPSDEIVCD